MNRSILAATTLAGLLLAGAASAQSTPATGTITINGSVAPKCNVSSGGGGTFGATVNLNELADADGTLRDDLVNATAAAPAFTSNFTLTCTSANIGVAVTATALDNTGVTSAPGGYSQTINLTGRALLDTVTPGTVTVDDNSAVAGSTSQPLGALLANSANNVRVEAFGFNTPNATDLLVAGPYTGQVVVVLTPS